jgi:hypothetical protein
MATLDIKKRYRISTQLAGKISKINTLNSVTTGLNIEDNTTGIVVRLDPIVLDFRNRFITATICSISNEQHVNFSYMNQEWFEFIEANFFAQINIAIIVPKECEITMSTFPSNSEFITKLLSLDLFKIDAF